MSCKPTTLDYRFNLSDQIIKVEIGLLDQNESKRKRSFNATLPGAIPTTTAIFSLHDAIMCKGSHCSPIDDDPTVAGVTHSHMDSQYQLDIKIIVLE